MPSTSKTWPGYIPDSDVDPDSPLSTDLFVDIRDSLSNLADRVGVPATYDENVADHDHDGLNSAAVETFRADALGLASSRQNNAAGSVILDVLAFTPTLAILLDPRHSGAPSWRIRTMGMPSGRAQILSNNNFETDVSIQSEQFGGVRIREDWAGASGYLVYCLMLATKASRIASGTYSGNGTTQSPTHGLGATPDVVFVIRENTGGAASVFRMAAHTGASSRRVSGDATNQGVTATSSTTFTVGTDSNVNNSGDDYRWFAFKAGNLGGGQEVGYIAWTGDATASRDITGLGFSPDFVIVIRCDGTTKDVVGRTRFFDVDEGWNISGSSQTTTGSIRRFLADGFRVGSGGPVNESGIAYAALCFKGPQSAV